MPQSIELTGAEGLCRSVDNAPIQIGLILTNQDCEAPVLGKRAETIDNTVGRVGVYTVGGKSSSLVIRQQVRQ
jgi:hypothetical protein